MVKYASNNASTIGLDSSVFTVTSIKNGQNNHVGLNKAGQIRLYAGLDSSKDGAELVVSVGAGYTIKSVKVTFGATNNGCTVTVDGTASKVITVRQQVTGATIQDTSGTVRTSIRIFEGTTMTLKAIATPSYAYNTRLNWKAVGDAIALSHADSASGENITLTGVKPGNATIQVTANDPSPWNCLCRCAGT